jgi:hypothetical protein
MPTIWCSGIKKNIFFNEDKKRNTLLVYISECRISPVLPSYASFTVKDFPVVGKISSFNPIWFF